MHKLLPRRSRLKICKQLADENLVDKIGVIDVGSANRNSILPRRLKGLVDLVTFDLDDFFDSAYRSHTHIKTLVGRSQKNIPFYLTAKRECSSFRKPNMDVLKRYRFPERFEVEEVLNLDVDALDNLVDTKRHFDLVKIDTQGYELEVLKGGKQIIAQASAVICEVSISELYQGAPKFHEVCAELESEGFICIDAAIVSWNSSQQARKDLFDGVAVFGDLLFVDKKLIYPNEDDVIELYQLINAIFILVLQGLPIVALQINRLLKNSYPETHDKVETIISKNLIDIDNHPFGRRNREEYVDL